MSERNIRALVILEQPDDARLLQDMVEGIDDDNVLFTQAYSLREASELLVNESFHIILLDLGLSDSQGLESFSLIRSRYPDIPVVVLGGIDDEQLAIRAVKEGAQDYLVKQKINGRALLRTIRYSVERCIAMERETGSVRRCNEGRIIALIGAKGGVGVTTLALSIVAMLAQRSNETTLAEIHGQYSTLSRLLSLRPVENLSHLAASDAHLIDQSALNRCLLPTRFGVRVLLGPQTADEELPLNSEFVAMLMSNLEALNDFTVLDLPAYPSEAEMEALRRAWRVYIVTETDPACLCAAEVALERLRITGVAGQIAGAIVVNRISGLNADRSMEEVSAQLGIEVIGAVPPAAEACAAAQRAGMPVVLTQPESVYSASLGELTDRISNPYPARVSVL